MRQSSVRRARRSWAVVSHHHHVPRGVTRTGSPVYFRIGRETSVHWRSSTAYTVVHRHRSGPQQAICRAGPSNVDTIKSASAINSAVLPEKPAALLTKTQRERIASDFRELSDAKRRRDQRQIRERVAAGLDDFGYLVDYPDEQFELAFDQYDDETVERMLGELSLVTERLRLLHDIERETVVGRARGRVADIETSERTLAALDVDEAVGGGDATARAGDRDRLRRRSTQSLKLGIAVGIPGALFAAVPPGTVPAAVDGPVVLLSFLFAGAALGIGLAGIALHGLKHDLLPALGRFRESPRDALRAAWERL